MKINTTVQYGLMAAGYIAQRAEEGWVRATSIAQEFGIPPQFLLKILQQLARTNVFTSKRGPGGGFALARPANEITLLEIIEAADGPISTPLEIAELTGNAEFSVEMEKVCDKALEEASSILAKAKLSQMVG